MQMYRFSKAISVRIILAIVAGSTWSMNGFIDAAFANPPFAQGLEVRGDFLSTYCTWTVIGADSLMNTGGGTITIDSIVGLGDPDEQYFPKPPQPASPGPFTINEGNSVILPITFAPGGDPSVGDFSGDRTYMARWIVYNSTGTPDTITNRGRGFVVRVSSHISCPLPSIIYGGTEIVPVIIDAWDDSLRTSYINGLVFQMTYFNDSVLDLNKEYNLNGQGEQGTISQSALVLENIVEDTLYTKGKRGYYELSIVDDSNNMGKTGTLIDLKFQGIRGLDSSDFVYDLRMFNDSSGNSDGYIYSLTSNGCVWVDSTSTGVKEIAEQDIPFLKYWPNPVLNSEPLNLEVGTLPGNVKVQLIDPLGRIVRSATVNRNTVY